ncbi:hypothetical protein F4780DRAFT_762558 [Xylariomycetidae sp. FL0641]|nr:hypothetical protein F4780DRAFT_762558 [Xylariomycetidae sp. FL0641]
MSQPPYAPQVAAVGGLPTILPDVPISAVFLLMYVCFAAANMTILQRNNRKGHKFLMSGMIFGFCMSRIVTFSLRIAWANHPYNVRLAIAASIFVNAGILLIYVINLLFAQRLLRAKLPTLGWHPAVSIICKVFYAALVAALITVIVAVILTSYTLHPKLLRQCQEILKTAITFLFVFTTLPLFLLALAFFTRPKSAEKEELFGHGSIRSKAAIVLLSTLMCIFIAGFKCGTTWMPPRTIFHPAWYHSKAAFYGFLFVPEILVLSLLTFSRVDKRFHIPNGSAKPGDYSGRNTQPKEMGGEEQV